MERNYTLNVGDVVLIKEAHWGFVNEDLDKYVRVVGYSKYVSDNSPAVLTVPYNCELISTPNKGLQWKCGYESFGDNPLVLLNIKDDVAEASVTTETLVELLKEDSFCQDHYNMYYTLTEKDIKAGKIKVDAYWVAKQWKTGSRDDSGALWHSLKTIARFGEKNSKAREIKALYNQAIALARIYDVEL
jgi:hypothetical protein